MSISEELKKHILSINNEEKFNSVALTLFDLHASENPIYSRFIQGLPESFRRPTKYMEIPFLPISFFKNMQILLNGLESKQVFQSSGTTGSITSKHYVSDPNWYIENSLTIFSQFYGDIKDYCILALLPSYLERTGSSLIAMANELINRSNHRLSGFYLNNLNDLYDHLVELKNAGQKTILLGVSFALLDFCESYHLDFPDLIVMETGGMKGRRKELIREDLHKILKDSFSVKQIHSEYGMTELLSQAYSKQDGIFKTPPWMKVLIRDSNDPFVYLPENSVGGINIIDLANFASCPFIATQDLGKKHTRGFEILGRFDNSDIRGCNLLIA
jgi:hypothetical protein